MTLPVSGPLGINDIANEFGVGSSQPFASAYYGKPGLPTSGAVSFADCYGKSNVLFNPDGGDQYNGGPNFATVRLSCNQPAVWTYSGGGSGSSVSLASGATATYIDFSTTASGKVGRTGSWTVQGTSNGITRSFTVTCEAFGNEING